MHEERLTAEDDEGRSLKRAIALYGEMPSWAQGAQELRRLGMLLVLDHKRARAEDAPAPASSLPALSASLAEAPVHPLSWAYLAEAALLEEDDPARVFRYLKQSYRVAPIEPSFFFYRLGLALKCRRHWDDTFQTMLRRELQSIFRRAGWHPNRKRLIQLAKNHSVFLAFVERQLAPDQEALERFAKAVRSGR